MPAGIFRKLETCAIGEGYKLSHRSQYSGCISRIKATVMESSAVYLYTTNRSRRISQGRRQPA